jgi:hypothetical protein
VIKAMVALAVLLSVALASAVVLKSGLDEARLAWSPTRRDLVPSELERAHGWLATFGCIRHDLAVGVTRQGTVYRLGEADPHNDEGAPDRVFTPLADREECDEGRSPTRLYALVEDDDSLGDTITHVYRQRVAPPPVPAIVSGVIGYGAGHPRMAAAARRYLADRLHLPGFVGEAPPLLVKGKQPGVLWVALTTVAAGVHGFLFAALGVWWMVRRARRRRAILSGQIDPTEEEFFNSETL